jgi:hypothetical protein
VGVIIQKNGNGGVPSLKSILNPKARAERKSDAVTPKGMGAYLTVALLAAAVVMVLIFSGK